MAIPISEYIDITTVLPEDSATGRAFDGLVFTLDEMVSGASKKEDYDDGKVIAVFSGNYSTYFANTTAVYKFAVKYFGNGGKRLYVAKVLTEDETTETALAAYNRVIANFQNFGSFTFVGTTWTNGAANAGGLLDVATANASNGYEFVRPTTATDRATDKAAFYGIVGTALVQDAVASGEPNLGAAGLMGWYSNVDYANANASSTPDYKNYAGYSATVTSLADKQTCDGLRVNYVGLVQAHGFQRSFFQKGVNCDGTDIGAFRDAMWIEGQIEDGWFNLVGSTRKVPANDMGAAMVRNMVVGTAVNGIENGCILVDKTFTADQITIINAYANNDRAADEVQTVGYYVDTKIVKDGSDYKCQYTLIYAKGDHISKVVGQHILV